MDKVSKKYTAALAGLLILLYHCWIPVFKYGTVVGSVERFIVTGSFVGVDLFFFLSAYSLSDRPVEMALENGMPKEYLRFLLNRAIKILPLFIVALFFKQFLWFLPAIMIMYIVFPPIYNVCKNKPALSFFLLFGAWAGLTGLVLGVLKPSYDLGIFLFRIPIIILGAYAARTRIKLEWGTKMVLGILLTAAGTILVYQYAYINRLNTPFKGTFYLAGIPQALGLALLISALAETRAHFQKGIVDLDPPGVAGRMIQCFGSMTLELYFMQMVLSAYLVDEFFRVFQSRVLTNIGVMAAVICASAVLHLVLSFINGIFNKGKGI